MGMDGMVCVNFSTFLYSTQMFTIFKSKELGTFREGGNCSPSPA